ncbi:MAG TPA: hypothetical protein VFR17_12510 [Mycobacterium sp.]|nr:hypothetical protein [Mycobacterium sp.]
MRVLKNSLARLTVVAVTGATALSVAACSTSNTSNDANTAEPSASASPPSAAPPKPPPPPPMGKDEVEGLVRSVSDSRIVLEQRDRSNATVDFTQQTMITELTSAQLTDVTPGSCVDVEADTGSAPPGGAVTAHSVTINPPVDGGCPPAAPASGASAESRDVDGKVASVTGDTIDVTSVDHTGKTATSTVTVTGATTYSKHAVTNSQAIQNGKCLAARGTDSDGVLHATTIDIEPCPPMGGGHRHRFLPYILPYLPRIPAIPHVPHVPHIPAIPHIP